MEGLSEGKLSGIRTISSAHNYDYIHGRIHSWENENLWELYEKCIFPNAFRYMNLCGKEAMCDTNGENSSIFPLRNTWNSHWRETLLENVRKRFVSHNLRKLDHLVSINLKCEKSRVYMTFYANTILYYGETYQSIYFWNSSHFHFVYILKEYYFEKAPI